jgi:parvulin-like peptidyl-prolyl isomerase
MFSCSPKKAGIPAKLNNISTVEEAQELREKHPEWEVEIIEAATDGKKPSEVLQRLIDGEILRLPDSTGPYHKVVNLSEVNQFNVKYIFFDGKKLSQESINQIRKDLMKRYFNGEEFSTLANQFTMDGSTNGGELGWMNEHDMEPEMIPVIKKQSKGQIFPLDIPDKELHYLMLKEQNDRKVLRMFMVKVNEK